MMRNILLMDLDNTILDFTRSEREALTKALEHYNIKATDELLEQYALINQKYWALLERKEVTREEILYKRFEEFFESSLSSKIDGHKINEIYHNYLVNLGYPLPESESFLKKAKAQGYKIFIISNGSKSINPSRIEASGLKNILMKYIFQKIKVMINLMFVSLIIY